ncbi:MAG TPA: sigma-54 dependent transcriptional regulator [candidate division Zixibacteria bacterium]|nr:sigma-54 dependent transcriptional regulator [candidate division Zixibacteria bacterium]
MSTTVDKKGRILIVDDDPLNLAALVEVFVDDYEVVTATSGMEAIDKVKTVTDIDTIILDIRMAELDGLKTARLIREIDSDIPLIFHTAYPGDYSEEEVEQDHKPYDYVGKNERPSRLIRSVRNAVQFNQLRTKNDVIVDLARQEYGMIGRSKVMCDVYRLIEQIGPKDGKVMILGPTGSGKELVAKALHRRSRRSDKVFNTFNCNHRTPDLVESELFGHKRGAFTGAMADREGLLQATDGGTLFLDEIGNLDHTTQGKLLRVLEYGTFSPVGENRVIKVNVRLFCATNADLEEMVARGTFREDLYFRLKGVSIRLSPLKERREDIPELVRYFADIHCKTESLEPRVFSPEAYDLLIEFDWPGNVRQLKDTVESLIDLSPSTLITHNEVRDFLKFEGINLPPTNTLSDKVREFKRIEVIKAIYHHKSNKGDIADALGIHRANLKRLLDDLNIDINQFD